MAPKGKKKNKVLKKVSSTKNVEKYNINSMLNDDCLLHIFEYLTLLDKINLEIVCKRWSQLSQTLWFSIKSLELDENFNRKYLESFDNRKEKTQFIINVIKRCGGYLTKLYIDNDYAANLYANMIKYSEILNIVPKFCHNLINLNLRDSYFMDYSMVNDNNLEKIFIKNKNLKSISLMHNYLEGNCFLKLNANNIEEINFDKIEIKSNRYLYRFIRNLKNLKVFEFESSDDYTKNTVLNILAALNMSQCKNLLKFSFSCGQFYETELFNKRLFQRQQKLRQFSLKYIDIDEKSKEFMECLPVDSLEYLDIQFNNSVPSFIHRFSNLQVLKCNFLDLNDESVKTITNIDLKELDIKSYGEYLLTKAGESCFKRLKNMESFTLFPTSGKNCDTLLIALSECKRLINLSFDFNEVTKIGLESISSLPNLEKLNIAFTKVQEAHLIDFVKNSLSLKKLDIYSWENITNKFFEAAYKMKKERNDYSVLEITCARTNVITLELKN